MASIKYLRSQMKDIQENFAGNLRVPIDWLYLGPILIDIADAAERLLDSEARLKVELTIFESLRARKQALEDMKDAMDRLKIENPLFWEDERKIYTLQLEGEQSNTYVGASLLNNAIANIEARQQLPPGDLHYLPTPANYRVTTYE